MKVTALLIDDEEYVRRLLAAKLSEHCPEIEILDEARDGEEAYEKILNLKPQLIFLDISMPRMGGFELLQKLPELDFEIIFVTSYDQYAIEAIEFCAIGYLVKPLEDGQLIKAVNNAIDRIENTYNSDRNKVLIENFLRSNNGDRKIAIPSQQGLDFVKVNDIVRCEGFQKYTKIYSVEQKVLLSSYNIGRFAQMLEPFGFFKPHKSHLINSRFIVKYFKEGTIVLKDGSTVPLAKRKKHEFIQYINSKFE